MRGGECMSESKTYAEAVAFLDSFVNYERTPQPAAMRAVKLERMRRLCQQLGNPQQRFRSILVTGTNGKGSVCAMLYSMLRESGLRAGLYTSPHIEHLRERIRLWTAGSSAEDRRHSDDWITEDEILSALQRLRPALEAMRAASPTQPPTYFEAITALAFLVFAQRHVEIAVLEVGLGGRLDATNVVEQAVSVITPIALDHTEILGADPAAIAEEKAGIIKPGQTVITAPQSPDVLDVLRAACDARGARLIRCGEDVTARIDHQGVDGLHVAITGLRGIYGELEIPLLGRHQADNAAVAVAALEALAPTGMPHGLVERGLARVEWPGRLEVVNETPIVVMDGAHNPHAAAILRETLETLWPGRAIQLILGMSADKPIEEVGRLLGEMATGVTCTKSHHPRALDPTVLAKRIAPWCRDVHVMSDPTDALTYVLNAVPPSSVIVVTGSLFLVGELRAAIRLSHLRPRRTPRPVAAAA